MRDRFVQVLVDCFGIEGLLTYEIPEGMAIAIGDILTVPLGARYVGAIALQFPQQDPEFAGEIKQVYAQVSSGMFSSHYWELLTRTANYYRTPLIQTVKAALPPKLLDSSSYRIRINSSPLSTSHSLPPSAQAVWEFLLNHTDQKNSKKGVSRRYLLQQLPRHGNAGLRELQRLGYVSTYLEPPHRPQPKLEKAVTLLPIHGVELTDRQQEILTILQRLGGEVLQSELLKQAKTSSASLQNLVNKGCIAIHQRECLRLGGKNHVVAADQPKQLTEAQRLALISIQQALQLQQHNQNPATPPLLLLHGVTGSGKTEVYLQAIAPLLQQGKSALVLVPEIGLTPQLTDRFRARFGDTKVNIYHSQLSDGERFDTWRQMLTGEAQVVIGTRSAVFTPLHHLGLIILDEEHDPSFKQDQPQPCYHARTVAQWRSQLEQCPLVLGSATPSTEMLYLVSSQQIQYLTLPDRIGNKPMPPITIVDMREELKLGNRSIFSQHLQAAIAQMLEQKKQGILFIHRRGHSTFVSCRSCGYVMNCPHCDVSLSYHTTDSLPLAKKIASLQNSSPPLLRGAGGDLPTLRAGNLICHYCSYNQLKPSQCPECGSPYFKHFGSGTQKVEQEIANLFPALRIIRFDSDTTRNKDQHRILIEKFQQGEADLLIGTQMLTKGLDIPQVTLVGVVSADGLLNFSDYRASERAFQVLTQVSGRAGRGEDHGEVIIQTYTPEHPVIEAVQHYHFDAFMRTELSHRAALNYPPIGQMVLIHLSSESEIAVETAATKLADYLQQLESNWQVLGPVPAAIARIKNRYRWQILLKFEREFFDNLPSLEEVKMLVDSRVVRVAIDVDPLNIS